MKQYTMTIFPNMYGPGYLAEVYGPAGGEPVSWGQGTTGEEAAAVAAGALYQNSEEAQEDVESNPDLFEKLHVAGGISWQG